jgi:dienelactone hydrolase
MNVYEIINPSDKCTIEADDPLVASVAILCVFNGSYSLHDKDNNQVLPLFLFGSADEWLKEQGINDLNQYFKDNKDALIYTLESILYGGFEDRAFYNETVKLMDKEKIAEYRQMWNDNRRTSATNIEFYCLKNAERLKGIK